MRHEFHPEALAEFLDAALYYTDCRPGLELRFIECIQSTIHDILQGPKLHRVFEEDVRRCLTPVFPYAVLYTLEPDYVLIIAVMHCHREPGYWRYRTL
jgi:hypothetical protein